MSNEEQLLEYWRKLSVEAQQQVLELTRLLQPDSLPDPSVGAPDLLTIQSRQQLDRLLQEGLESGDSIELTDEWWVQKRSQLFNNLP
jgi:hypothetical protein